MFSDEDKAELLRRARQVVFQDSSTTGWREFKYGELHVTFSTVIAGTYAGVLSVYVDNWPVVKHATRVREDPKTHWRAKSDETGPAALDLLRRAMALDDLAGI